MKGVKKMLKNLKKILSKIVAVVFLLLMSMPLIQQKTASADTLIPIDMYLIAGQSNAAGYSSKNISSLNETFENVGYAGEADRNFRTGSPSSSRYLEYEDFVWGVRKGLGASASHVGPEYGIAKAINSHYENRADGRKAFIFKTASGGTSLRDIDGAVGTTVGNYGNWYPRSLWEDGYAPNTETYDSENDATGYLYALFLKNFEKVYNELKENGYAPVIKGFAWMQGCQDLGHHDQYERLLETFIVDMRSDLVKITGDTTVNVMPLVIGKIATSFVEYNNWQVSLFNSMQEKVAENMGNSVATIETSDLIIVNEDTSVNGTDKYHFNCNDMRILGERFGETLLALNGKKTASIGRIENGAISYAFLDDGKLCITVTPENGKKEYRLETLLVNGQDVTEHVNGNVYIIDTPEDKTYISAEFIERDKHSISYTMDEKLVGLVFGPSKVYDNSTLTFEVATKTGYEITKVTANGVDLDLEPSGIYEITNIQSNLEIAVQVKKIETSGEPGLDDSGESASDGCSSSLSVMRASIFVACGSLVLLKRKKVN